MRQPQQRLVFLVLTAAIAIGGYELMRDVFAQEGPDWHDGLPRQYKSKWRVHDLDRPKPPTVTPGARPQDPPSDAIVLFDGKDTSRWEFGEKGPWNVAQDSDGRGYMEVNHTGGIKTKASFEDCQLHLEYRAPTPPQKVSQARGNSGIFFMGKYEVQILDNYENSTYSDGYIGAVYGQHPPIVNAARKPGEWQTFDIIFRAPRWDGETLVEPARVTVLLNGVVVQHNAEVYGSTTWRNLAKYKPHGPGPIHLQDHGDRQNPRFRNIWIRKLDLSPEALDNRT